MFELACNISTFFSFSIILFNTFIPETSPSGGKKYDIYIPLKGESFDGENFIENSIINGAMGYFTTDKNKIYEDAQIIMLVSDTKEAYLKLAHFYKQKINPFTIAITGSSGKTTVKEMMYSVFKNNCKYRFFFLALPFSLSYFRSSIFFFSIVLSVFPLLRMFFFFRCFSHFSGSSSSLHTNPHDLHAKS